MPFAEAFLEKVRRFDAYPKTLEDFSVKTYGGATVTVISGILMSILFISELNFYLTPELTEELLVDVSRGEKLRINVDIIFPHIGCSFLSIDAIDVSGEQHINIEHNVYKRRMDLEGKPIEGPVKEESIGRSKNASKPGVAGPTTVAPTTLDPNRCESCFGAETMTRTCCNTCDEVRQAYNEKGWALRDMATVAQCKREGIVEDRPSDWEGEGCQIFGYVEVSRVGGNLHIAPGRSMTRHHAHVHDLSPRESLKANVTHKLRHLSFGRNVPGKSNPLDGTHQVADKGSMAFQYYIKIVPTMYAKTDGSTLQTNQFAVTRHKKQVEESLTESGLPGVFFIYEFAPMMVKYSEKSKSFTHFLTSVCAIVGGIFTVAGIIDSMVYHSVRAIQKKIELGKAS